MGVSRLLHRDFPSAEGQQHENARIDSMIAPIKIMPVGLSYSSEINFYLPSQILLFAEQYTESDLHSAPDTSAMTLFLLKPLRPQENPP